MPRFSPQHHAHRTRVRLLGEMPLSGATLTTREVAKRNHMSSQTAYQHLKALADAGWVERGVLRPSERCFWTKTWTWSITDAGRLAYHEESAHV